MLFWSVIANIFNLLLINTQYHFSELRKKRKGNIEEKNFTERYYESWDEKLIRRLREIWLIVAF